MVISSSLGFSSTLIESDMVMIFCFWVGYRLLIQS